MSVLFYTDICVQISAKSLTHTHAHAHTHRYKKRKMFVGHSYVCSQAVRMAGMRAEQVYGLKLADRPMHHRTIEPFPSRCNQNFQSTTDSAQNVTPAAQ